jgi:glycosyltransferase involved in cell wall biosynthesis
MDKLLTIAIPTYNRANRLEKSLNDLLSQIIKSEKKQYLSVFVSDNGSTDTTAAVINKYSDIFKQNNIIFSSHSFSNNRGFDANVLNCYRKCDSEYVWFLSDDDNIIDGAINSIIDDIHKYAPNVLYYNFDQDPYNLDNPYNKTTILFDHVDENIESISKIIAWAKLTALVIKRIGGQSGEKGKNLGHLFMHLVIALQTALDYGMVLHSEKFIARPDKDYMNHIDFPPYIGNYVTETVDIVLRQNNRSDIYQKLNIERVDPLTTSMNWLIPYYRGKFVLTTELKSQLYSTVVYELKNLKITKIKMVVLKSIIKLFISYAYNMGHMVLTGKSATRLRKIKKNI